MTMPTGVESIIQKTNSSEPSAGESLVLYDRTRRTTLESRPLVSLLREIETYRVLTNTFSEVARLVRLVLPTPFLQDTHEAVFFLRHQVSCPKGKESKAVAALAVERSGMNELFDAKLIQFTRDFIDGQQRNAKNFVLDFFALRNDLVARLKARTAEEIGLDLHVSIEFNLEQETRDKRPVKVSTGPLTVQLKDYPRPTTVTVSGQIALSPDHFAVAILKEQLDREKRDARLLDHLRDIVRRQVNEVMSINDLAESRLPEVRARLRAIVNAELGQSEGWVFDYLEFVFSDLPHPPPERINFRVPVDVHVRGSETKVTIEHTVSMQLESLARYHATLERDPSCRDPRAWMIGHLESISWAALFNHKYSSLVLAMRDEDLRGPMQEKAYEVGYVISQYSALPKEKIQKYREDGVKIAIDRDDFLTSDLRIRVGLAIAGSASLPLKLELLESYIRPDLDLEEEINRVTAEVAQDVLHKVAPERFYTQFSSVEGGPEGRARGRISVSSELKDAIEQTLIQRFHLAQVNVTFKMTETKITKRYLNLLQGIHNIEITLDSLLDAGISAPITLVLHYQITGMAPDGWSTFQANDYQDTATEIARIEEVLKATFKANFGVLTGEQISYRTRDRWTELHEVALTAIEQVTRAFGLTLSITNLYRKLSPEEEMRQGGLQARIDELKDRIGHSRALSNMERSHDLGDLDVIREEMRKKIQLGLGLDDEDLAALNAHQTRLSGKNVLPDSDPFAPPPEPTTDPIDVAAHRASMLDPAQAVAGRKRPTEISDRHDENGAAAGGSSGSNDADVSPQ